MSSDRFFEVQGEQSVIKSMIVRNYFKAWTQIMLPRVSRTNQRLAYIDLFSGPGRYEDGSMSTPLWVLSQSVSEPRLCSCLVALFNDSNPNYAGQLRADIATLPGIDQLKYPPKVSNFEVGQELVDLLQRRNLVPTLFFIDPFGYKGISLDLIGTTIKEWGCDCIFFFNYNRINPGIGNPSVVEHMNDLFGVERAERLRERVRNLTSEGRQALIISELTEALKEVGGRHVLPFEFQSQHGERTSHYVVFVSKVFIGYHIMKEVMAKLSSDDSQVRQFRYVPVKSDQMSLFPDFGKTHSIPLLKEVLVETATGMSATVWNIYERFTMDTPYTLANVKDAIRALEIDGRVTVDVPAAKRIRSGKVTLGDKRIVTFPT